MGLSLAVHSKHGLGSTHRPHPSKNASHVMRCSGRIVNSKAYKVSFNYSGGAAEEAPAVAFRKTVVLEGLTESGPLKQIVRGNRTVVMGPGHVMVFKWGLPGGT